MRKIIAIVGTRPDAIKMAPVVKAFREYQDWQVKLAASGQHREMLQQVLDAFGLSSDINYEVMRHQQTLAYITSAVLNAFDELFAQEKPDLVIAQGDTTTTLCAGMAAFYRRIPFAHVEAGLRTDSIWAPFPEEFNRRATAQLACLQFAPTRRAVQNLLAERVPPASIMMTGNTSIDAVLEVARQPRDFTPPGVGRMLLVTTHRRENWGEPQRRIGEAVSEILRRNSGVYAVLPMHPNRAVREVLEGVLGGCERAILCEPPPYPTFVQWMKASYLILTDSGGIQEEAPALHKPVLVLREETERPEGIEVGAAVLVGTEKDRIVRETERLLCDEEAYQRMASAPNPYGDGLASRRIRAGVRRFLGLPFEEVAPFGDGEKPFASPGDASLSVR